MTNTNSAPIYTHRFWAKSEPRQGYPKRIHLLEHHLADVGACFEALLAQPTIRQRLARTGGRDDLGDATVARLCVFAALHDIGKVNVGFQTQIWQDADFPNGRRPAAFRHVGHYNELAPILRGEDAKTTERFFGSLKWWWDATESWDDCGGKTVCALFIAALSHHGRPLQLEGNKPSNRALWERCGDLDPFQAVQHIGELAREWFPAAFQSDATPLPSAPKFQHHFLGLCILADWIGSNEDRFPFCGEPLDNYMEAARQRAKDAVSAVGLDLLGQRRKEPPGFNALFPHIDGPANAMQRAAAETSLDEPVVVIESETGSGKTEAALWRFALMYEQGLVDGLYFALPTRAAAVQIHGRVKDFVANLFPEKCPPAVVLAVPGYDPDAAAERAALLDYDSHAAGHPESERPWASENPKRYLAAQIAVGTVDQAMLGALKVKHAHLRAACLSRNLLVVDEVHASDTYMRRILKALLDAHRGAGGYALLMSATLGSVARRQWLSAGRVDPGDAPTLAQAKRSPYPAVSAMSSGGEPTDAGENNQEKNVSVSAEPLIGGFQQVSELALSAARAGAKVLVVRNTVGYAVRSFRALEEAARPNDIGLLFSIRGVPTLHHGRFAAPDRRLLDAQVEHRLGRNRAPGGLIVVGTQTLEQSLDIDADLLITDLCPVDVLLQRIGRLHRHRRNDRPTISLPLGKGAWTAASPASIVLTPEGEDLSPLLRSPLNGLGRYVYPDLRILEATRRLIVQQPQWRIPDMNRDLVEQATHTEALEDIATKLGNGWVAHGRGVDGTKLADGQNAASALIRRDKSFFADNRDVLFGSAEERIRTRLGDESLEVDFGPPQPSPFDPARPISRISIPLRWLGDAEVPETVEPSPAAEGGSTFTIGDRTFHYDRMGLRRT